LAKVIPFRLVIVSAAGSTETDPGRLDLIVNLYQAGASERFHAGHRKNFP
jgi:hypothetical protein